MSDTILKILLLILSILGICVLTIIGIIILLIIIFLFVPFRYELSFEKYENTKKLHGKLTWLSHSFRAFVDYQDKLCFRIYFIFFKLYDSEQIKHKDSKKMKSPANTKEEKSIVENKSMNSNIVESKEETDYNSSCNQSQKETYTYENKSSMKEEPIKHHSKIKRSSKEKKKPLIDTFKYYINILKDEKNIETLKSCKTRIFKVLKSVIPQKLRAKILFGTGFPDSTGYVLAIIGMLYPYIGNKCFIEADFENKIFQGNGYLKGRIYLFIVLYQAIRIYFNKEMRNLISQFKREE